MKSEWAKLYTVASSEDRKGATWPQVFSKILSHSAFMLGRILPARAEATSFPPPCFFLPCGIPKKKQQLVHSSRGSSHRQCVLHCPFVLLCCSYMSAPCLSEACWNWNRSLVLQTALGHVSCFKSRLAKGGQPELPEMGAARSSVRLWPASGAAAYTQLHPLMKSWDLVLTTCSQPCPAPDLRQSHSVLLNLCCCCEEPGS